MPSFQDPVPPADAEATRVQRGLVVRGLCVILVSILIALGTLAIGWGYLDRSFPLFQRIMRMGPK